MIPPASRALAAGALAILLLGGSLGAEEPAPNAFVGKGTVRLLVRPEFRDPQALWEEFHRAPVEGLRVELVGPLVPVPPSNPAAAPPPPVPSRLLFEGAPETLARARALLRVYDVPKPTVVVSLLMAEVRAFDDRETGGHVLFDRNRDPGAPDTLFRAAASDFEPDSYLRSTLTGSRPFAGSSLTFGTSQSGLYERVLRALLEKNQAEFLAWPVLACSEGVPATLDATESTPQTKFSRTDPTTTWTPAPSEETGVRLSLNAVRIGDDEATLDLTAWIRVANPSTSADTDPNTYVFSTREVTTRISVRDRSTTLLGGLRLRQAIGSRRGVPGLQDLCVVGPLYGARAKQDEVTEILFLLCTRIVTPGLSSGYVRSTFDVGARQGPGP